MIYFIFLSLINLPILVISRLLALILPLFATEQIGYLNNGSAWGLGPRLPTWMSWFQTPDNSLYGDDTFIHINGKSYLSQVKWLRRNPAYSFGLQYIDATTPAQYWGDNTIRDNDNAKAGWCFVRVGSLFQFTWVKPIGFSRCLYCNFGWNIRALVDDNVNPKPNPYQATFVCSPRLSGFR